MTDRPVAIVTGAGRGIGAAIADGLDAKGFAVARLDLAWPDADPQRFVFDLRDVKTHEPCIADVIARWGRIDCLINNAGIASPKRGDFMGLAAEDFDTVIDTNLRGTVFFTQNVLKAMLDKTSPHPRSIQFITSASAAMASPERLDYCMSKAALAMFSKGLALRLADQGISVFEVRPGIIRTDMTAGVAAKYDRLIADGFVPERRWGKPEDVASVCMALASGALPFSTGSIIETGGGLTIPRL
jgi:3-oxoacyl-[acyl-carrier protein] reductase